VEGIAFVLLTLCRRIIYKSFVTFMDLERTGEEFKLCWSASHHREDIYKPEIADVFEQY